METTNTREFKDYVRLEGSERHPAKSSKLIGPANETEVFKITIVLRRRVDGPPMPDFSYYGKATLGKRKTPTQAEFAALYGAHPDDIDVVADFVEKFGLKVKETHVGRRNVEVQGTVAQMSNAFAVELGRYEYTPPGNPKDKKQEAIATYRGRDGYIYVPKHLDAIIINVFGLDNQQVVKHAGLPADPPETNLLFVEQVKGLYNFPNPGAAIADQTIGIISMAGYGGYLQSDINLYYNWVNMFNPEISPSGPAIYPVSIDGFVNGSVKLATSELIGAGSTALAFVSTAQIINGSSGHLSAEGAVYSIQVTEILSTNFIAVSVVGSANGFPVDIPAGTDVYFNMNIETTQDICIASSAAPGANIAVYFGLPTPQGWFDLVNRAIQPNPGDLPTGVNPPTVLTSSYFFAGGDDNTGSSGVSKSDMDTMDMAFQDAAVYGITVCICTGDSGSNAGVADEYVHVVSPANDPWVLAVGGTTIGQYQPSDSSLPLMWEEFVWNDALTMPPNATGGGVSDYFPVPDYQTGVGIPNSLNLVLDPSGTFNTTGRGIPDVAGNASLGSGYLIYLGDKPAIAAGTSSSTPLWAGLIAMLNSNLGFNLGFVNPILYGLGESAFNPINPLWPDPDYPQLTSCPADNGINGIPGYPAGPGWDACTGLGSPNGNAILTAIQNLARPDAYILGGYQSASIIISDPSTSPPTVIPIGGFPGGVWDTLLKPDTDYLFFVVVTNDSPAPASGVEVRFWGIPYGIATYGYMIGTPQTVAIPAYSSITVLASAPFVSGDVGEHLCAAVTIYNPQSGYTTQILNAADIPDPGPAGSHGCTAWRNTDSMTAAPASHFTFNLGMGHVPIRYPGPVIIRMKPIHIPFYWNRLTKVTGIAQALRFIGAENALPLYLLPEIIKDFPQIWLGTTLEVSEGVKIERAENNQWQIFPAEQSEKTSFKISGKIPGSARPRDIVLIEISANYPAAGNRPARRVMFYETIHITDRLKK